MFPTPFASTQVHTPDHPESSRLQLASDPLLVHAPDHPESRRSQLASDPLLVRVADIETGDAKHLESRQFATNVDATLRILTTISVYLLSIATFVAGVWLYLHPKAPDTLDTSTWLRYISATLLLVCGCMLLFNNDLIQTTVRMAVQLLIFSRDNGFSLEWRKEREADEVTRRQNLASGLEILRRQFGGDVRRAFSEVDRFRATTNTTARLTSSQLVKWYIEQNHAGVIPRGHEQDQAELLVADFFRKIVPDFEERHAAWRKALENNSVYIALDGIPTEKFALLVSALLAKDWKDGLMQFAVDRILCKANIDEHQISRYKSQMLACLQQKQASQVKKADLGFKSPLVSDFRMDKYSNEENLKVFYVLWLGSIIVVSLIAIFPAFGLV